MDTSSASKSFHDIALLLNQGLMTERLSLEALLGSHADILFQPMRDERIYRWIGAGGPKDLDQLRLKWQAVESRLSPDGNQIWLNWAIRLRKEGPFIGKLDAQLDSPTNVSNIGFAFIPNYWGKGYATESVLSVTSWLSQNGITSMRATVATPNTASSRVLEKAGFIRGQLSKTEKDTHEYDLVINTFDASEARQAKSGGRLRHR